MLRLAGYSENSNWSSVLSSTPGNPACARTSASAPWPSWASIQERMAWIRWSWASCNELPQDLPMTTPLSAGHVPSVTLRHRCRQHHPVHPSDAPNTPGSRGRGIPCARDSLRIPRRATAACERSGWPSKTTPKRSWASRSYHSAARQTPVTDGRRGSSQDTLVLRHRVFSGAIECRKYTSSRCSK